MLQTDSYLSGMSGISPDSRHNFPRRLIDRGHSAEIKRFGQLILELRSLISEKDLEAPERFIRLPKSRAICP